MGVRELVKIDEDKCDGCGLCVPACAEGAIQLIDGKARLVSEVYCDGLGACLGHCPQGAITVEPAEARPFDEEAVKMHLEKTAAPAPVAEHAHSGGCPGSRMVQFNEPETKSTGDETGARPSQLRQWPVQLHLVSPMAPYFKNADLLLTADCVPFAMGDFHRDHLKGRALAISCPKLDVNQEIYEDKLTAMIDQAHINTIQVMIMEVPCCGGLLALAQQAVARAQRKVPIKCTVVSLRGEVLGEKWV